MSRVAGIFSAGVVLAVFLGSAATGRSADKPAGDAAPAGKPADGAAPAAKPQPKKQLSPAMTELRDRVRQTLGGVYQQPFNTGQSSISDVIQFCRAFGCQSEIHEDGPTGQKVNGITCLCWNHPCGGREPLMVSEGHLAARVGYGYQEAPSQLAAMLALSRVPAEYPARAGDHVRTVADLIENEKLACRSGRDFSLKLVALAYYVSEPTWKNSLGEEWSVERMVREEMKQSLGQVPQAAVARLLAFSWALEQRSRQKLPVEGDFIAARKYVQQCQDYVLATENSDGSWGRAGRDPASALASTAGVLEWLVLSLPAARLEDPKIVQSIQFVSGALRAERYQWNLPSLSSQEVAVTMAAAHALFSYDAQVFAPADAPAAAPAAKQAAAKAGNVDR
ncbi:MAG: hypothetical protein ABR915_01615 [Thermoguttaceae bacterium]|jgi:hypothetical protein